MGLPKLRPHQLSPEARRPKLDSASAPPAFDDVSFLSLDNMSLDNRSFLTGLDDYGRPHSPKAKLDSATAPLALDDMSFITTGFDDAQTCASYETYPYNIWAYPTLDDLPITSRRRAIRSSLKQRHRSQVKKRRSRIALAKERRTLRLIAEHAKRVAILKDKKHRTHVAHAWLAVLAECASYRQVTSILEDSQQAKAELDARKAWEANRSENACVIQRSARSKLITEGVNPWKQAALFAGLMRKNRWRVSLHLNCWRRYHARIIVRDFLRCTEKLQGSKALLVFQQRVKFAQRLFKDWVDVRKRRRAFLRTVWDEVEDACRAEISGKKAKRLGDKPQASQRKKWKKPSVTEEVEDMALVFRDLEEDFDKMRVRQHELGVSLGVVAQTAQSIEVSRVPGVLRDAALADLFEEVCKRHKAGGIVLRKKAGAADVTVKAREFNVADASSILSLHSTKSRVKPLKASEMMDPRCLADKKPLMRLFTAFHPKTLHETVTELWTEAYDTQNEPVAALYLSHTVKRDQRGRRGALIPNPKALQRRAAIAVVDVAPLLSDVPAQIARHLQRMSRDSLRERPERRLSETTFMRDAALMELARRKTPQVEEVVIKRPMTPYDIKESIARRARRLGVSDKSPMIATAGRGPPKKKKRKKAELRAAVAKLEAAKALMASLGASMASAAPAPADVLVVN